MNSYILIVAAVAQELSKFMGLIKIPVSSIVGGRKIISGQIDGKSVKMMITGPGIANTVQALTAVIEKSRPCLLIQVGCGGAFNESGLHLGDIGIATREIDAYMGIETETGNFPLDELPFPLASYNNINVKNCYPMNTNLVDTAFKTLIKNCADKNIGMGKGPFITVPTITATNRTAKNLYKQFGAIMENMEGTGAAHLSMHYNIPFLEIRSVSNMVGKRDTSLWNLPLAFQRASDTIFELVCKLPDPYDV